LETDLTAGRLDQLVEDALQDLREGRCTDVTNLDTTLLAYQWKKYSVPAD
jgi:hypothetical protein